jgi:hypothetical protein
VSKTRQFFAIFYGENIFKIKISVPGVDVMITMFCDFRQFSAKKLALFSKINVTIKILHTFALFWVKSANFSAYFMAKIFLKSKSKFPGFLGCLNEPLFKMDSEISPKFDKYVDLFKRYRSKVQVWRVTVVYNSVIQRVNVIKPSLHEQQKTDGQLGMFLSFFDGCKKRIRFSCLCKPGLSPVF